MLHKIHAWLSGVLTLQNIRRMIEVIGGRRFFLTMGAGVVTSLLVWYAKISGEIYRDVILGTVGIYIAGNTIQKGQEIKAKITKGE